MALIVEDGTGKSTAESYLSEADGDSYHTAHANSSDWSGATTPHKEVALRRASQYLDMVYGAQWKGSRANEDQALDWPRVWADDRDDVAILHTELPQRLKDACAEAAERMLTEEMMPVQADPGVLQSSSVKVGPISTSKTYQGGRTPGKGYPKIDALVRGLLKATGMVLRG